MKMINTNKNFIVLRGVAESKISLLLYKIKDSYLINLSILISKNGKNLSKLKYNSLKKYFYTHKEYKPLKGIINLNVSQTAEGSLLSVLEMLEVRLKIQKPDLNIVLLPKVINYLQDCFSDSILELHNLHTKSEINKHGEELTFSYINIKDTIRTFLELLRQKLIFGITPKKELQGAICTGPEHYDNTKSLKDSTIKLTKYKIN